MKNLLLMTALLISVLCSNASACVNNKQNPDSAQKSEDKMETTKIRIKIGSKTFTATLEANKSAQAFKETLPLTLKMADHFSNEKHTDLSKSLPTVSSNPRTIHNGDLMLFGSRALVLFYKTISTSYSYTKLAKVNDATGLASALGSGNVTITFELEK